MSTGDSTISAGGASRTTEAAALRAIMAEHQRLDALLLRHQVLLVEGHAGASAQTLAAFQAALVGHMRGEEEVILPWYAARAEHPKGGSPASFQAEHAKLRRLVAEARAWMAAWHGLVWPAEEKVFLVEREKVLKEVLEHHDEREDHFLYPGLEDTAAGEEREGLVTRFWEVARAGERRLLDLARQDDPGGAPGGIRQAAEVACGWLEGIYEALVAGEERFRRRAAWGEALQRLRASRLKMEQADTQPALDELVGLLEEVTPLKCFPVPRAAEAHGAWHLLHACRRAALARQGAGPVGRGSR